MDNLKEVKQGPVVYGFIHVAQMNHWRMVLQSQVQKILGSGLLGVTDKIYIGVLGQDRDLDLPDEILQKAEISWYGELEQYEFPTLGKILEVSRRPQECCVWYIHSKGVSCSDYNRENWRNAMEYVVLSNWRVCLDSLLKSDAEVVGPFYQCRDGVYIFAGNFWWARGNYIVKLPDISTLKSENRYEAENWVCKAGPKVKTFWRDNFWDVIHGKPTITEYFDEPLV